jgi:hypothetical protein
MIMIVQPGEKENRRGNKLVSPAAPKIVILATAGITFLLRCGFLPR